MPSLECIIMHNYVPVNSHSMLELFYNEYSMIVIIFLIVVVYIIACTSVQVMLKFFLAIPIVH